MDHLRSLPARKGELPVIPVDERAAEVRAIKARYKIISNGEPRGNRRGNRASREVFPSRALGSACFRVRFEPGSAGGCFVPTSISAATY